MRNVNYETKECPNCKKEFIPNSGRQVYCSENCKLGIHECIICGKSFIPKGRHSSGNYCSLECWYKAPGRKVLQEINCKVCGKLFQPRESTTTTCSRKCADKVNIKNKEISTCLGCGKNFQQKTNVRKSLYCSISCYNRNRKSREVKNIGNVREVVGGYMSIKVGKDNPSANRDGWMMQHRYIMEQHLGRSLESFERVHHRDGNRSNNDISNLELFKLKSGGPSAAGIRQQDYHCPGCRCGELHV